MCTACLFDNILTFSSFQWSTDLLQEKVPNPTMAVVKCPVCFQQFHASGQSCGTSRPIQLTDPLSSQACFFWRAEMSLKTKNFKDLPLTRHLHQYNKVTRT